MPVLDFQRGPKPRNYLARREQWRLLMFVLMLGLVLILMLEARNPRHYGWLLAGSERGADGSANPAPSFADGRVDTRVFSPPEAEIPGVFLSPEPGVRSEPAPSRYFAGVDPRYLDTIRDNKPLGISEWEAWLHFFDVLQRSDEATLQGAATRGVGFVQLLEQSKEYRGELVTTRGVIRRAHSAKTPRNEYGLTGYYQTWLRPDDHPEDPMVVWCLHLPDGFPIGMEMAEPAEVTGFFFKLWAYKSADGTVRRTPMLLARTIHWHRRPEVAQTPPADRSSLTLMILGAAAFAVLGTAYVYYRTRRAAPIRVETLPDEETLRDADTAPDVAATLQQLAEPQDTPKQSPEPDEGSGP